MVAFWAEDKGSNSLLLGALTGSTSLVGDGRFLLSGICEGAEIYKILLCLVDS